MIPVRVHGAPELKMSSQQIAATMPAWKTDLVGTDQDRFSQASSAKWGSRGATQDSSPCKPPRGSDVISYHTTCLGHRQAMSEFKVCGKKLTSSCQHGHMVDWIWQLTTSCNASCICRVKNAQAWCILFVPIECG